MEAIVFLNRHEVGVVKSKRGQFSAPINLRGLPAGTFPVKITVMCDDRSGMLKQLTAVISDDNTNIRNIEARTGDGAATIDVVVDIEDMKHLDRITTGVRKISGVREVQRVKKL